MISPVILNFLKELSKNNNREWFAENKKFYDEAKEEFEHVVEKLISDISFYDKEIAGTQPKECIFRIYRDVRFSKDKTPYKTHFDAFIAKKGGRKSSYAGYYLHIKYGASLFGGGIYAPIPEILKSLREEIYNFPEEFKEILGNQKFRQYYGNLYIDKMKMTPKGFPSDFPDVELLKYKSYIVAHPLSNAELTSDKIEDELKIMIRTLYPFNSFLNRAIDFKEEITDF
ncbi:MAG: DUF2461 domain-containing protein [Chlorobi bacterium]|nr:DUF2461 domain-containing protein [Chlorobiota bacterium]